MSTLSVITLGHIHTEAIEPLTKHLTRLEQVVTNATSRAELNRAIDAAANDWILLLRERESVDDVLAMEIAQSMNGLAWGFRIRTDVIYAGKPLHIATAGELRLFHRRHLLRRGEVAVEGPVVRLKNSLRAISFGSYEEHREHLAKHGIPHSRVRQLLLFVRNARTLDANTLRYIWIEAGFDHA